MTQRIITVHKWPERFLALADHIGQWSKHERFKVGAVIVRPDRTIVSTGYNGAPRGVGDKPVHDEHSRAIHAELNAILSSHVPVKGYEMFCSWPPCDRCACHIIQAGITRVSFMRPPKASLPKWEKSFHEARALFCEAGVEVIEYWQSSRGGVQTRAEAVDEAVFQLERLSASMRRPATDLSEKKPRNAKKAPPRQGSRKSAPKT